MNACARNSHPHTLRTPKFTPCNRPVEKMDADMVPQDMALDAPGGFDVEVRDGPIAIEI